jgi:hypothetical protein
LNHEDIDAQLKRCWTKNEENSSLLAMTPVGPIMKNLVRGVEYAAEVYDLKALCSKLPLTAVMKVLNFDEGVMNAFIGQDEKN